MLLTQDFNEVNLTVAIEKQRINFYETVDKVYIPIAMNSFSESEEYPGMYGIARITLGYMFIVITSQDSSNAVQQG